MDAARIQLVPDEVQHAPEKQAPEARDIQHAVIKTTKVTKQNKARGIDVTNIIGSKRRPKPRHIVDV